MGETIGSIRWSNIIWSAVIIAFSWAVWQLIKRLLDAAGLEIPYDQLDIHQK